MAPVLQDVTIVAASRLFHRNPEILGISNSPPIFCGGAGTCQFI
ncbi:conserved hypothetical protein, partial [delta proteobacterium NaphS2]